jgi:hypothetical protein
MPQFFSGLLLASGYVKRLHLDWVELVSIQPKMGYGSIHSPAFSMNHVKRSQEGTTCTFCDVSFTSFDIR